MIPAPTISNVVPVTDRLIPRYNIPAGPLPDDTDFVSQLGLPVWSPLEFLATSGTSLDNALSPAGGVLLRVDTCLITVELPKIIQRTNIPGRSGSIKEYIGNDDFMINIDAMIVSPSNGVFPEADVKTLIELIDLNKQIPVSSEFLRRFGIDVIVVTDFRLSQKMGYRNEVPFIIQAFSDLPENIVIDASDEV